LIGSDPMLVNIEDLMLFSSKLKGQSFLAFCRLSALCASAVDCHRT
jgi:hypothetical protein